MEDHEAVGAEQLDERRGEQWIDERLREEDVRVLAALQEHAFGTARIFLPHADEILALVFEIQIVGQRVSEHVIGRGITKEAVVR
jgi:hypothetical protein